MPTRCMEDLVVIPLLELKDLANLLRRRPETIRRDMRRNPDAVPPRLQLPGTRLLRWRAEDVEAWIASHARGARGLRSGGLR